VLRQRRDDRVVLGLVLGFGLLFRLAVLPTPVLLSSDIYRYLWDGRVQRAGISPYRYPPAAPELAPLRDEAIHPHINRPDKRTVYPPGAEMLFALVTAMAPDSVAGWRLFLLGCEAATAALLLTVLRRMGRPPGAVVVYAWAPLAVFEGVQAGPLEAALLPLLLLALLWRQAGHLAWAGAAVGAGSLLKLDPAVLLVAWWRRGDQRFPAAALAVVAAGYLPYAIPVGLGVLGFLPEYFGSAEDFNVGLRHFFTEGLRPASQFEREVMRGALMLLLVGALLAALLRIRRRLGEGPRAIYDAGVAAVAAYLLLVPTALHAWYVLWIMPLLAVRLSPGWLWFSGAVALSYLTYAWAPAPFPLWVRALEYLPLWALLFWEWRARRPAPGADPVAAPGVLSARPSPSP
jgi:alpha-1,6-mannosyltransferase